MLLLWMLGRNYCVLVLKKKRSPSSMPKWQLGKMSAQLVAPQSMTVTVNDNMGSEDHYLPLVWDQTSWANRLYSQDSWPDLQRCVMLYFNANSGMQKHPQVREHPIPFECTDLFWTWIYRLIALGGDPSVPGSRTCPGARGWQLSAYFPFCPFCR